MYQLVCGISPFYSKALYTFRHYSVALPKASTNMDHDHILHALWDVRNRSRASDYSQDIYLVARGWLRNSCRPPLDIPQSSPGKRLPCGQNSPDIQYAEGNRGRLKWMFCSSRRSSEVPNSSPVEEYRDSSTPPCSWSASEGYPALPGLPAIV